MWIKYAGIFLIAPRLSLDAEPACAPNTNVCCVSPFFEPVTWRWYPSLHITTAAVEAAANKLGWQIVLDLIAEAARP